jgi:hypothetical protein
MLSGMLILLQTEAFFVAAALKAERAPDKKILPVWCVKCRLIYKSGRNFMDRSEFYNVEHRIA